MNQYLELLKDVLNNGVVKGDRTGTGTISVFGRQIRFNLAEGFPAVTTKKLFWKGVVGELLWFLKGDSNVKWLQENGIGIWDEWAKPGGELGPVYGVQWRRWYAGDSEVETGIGMMPESAYIDQLAKVIETIKANPNSRRMLVTAWNPADLSKMALEPCHAFFQFYVTPGELCRNCEGTGLVPLYAFDADGNTTNREVGKETCVYCKGKGAKRGKLSLQMYQRSADMFLGVPFNIASYALLTHMIAQVTDLDVGEYIHTFGDTHVYLNHMEQVNEQLKREPMPLPKLWLNPEIKDIDGFTFEDIQLEGYRSHPAIKAPVAV